jgi:uncharacterized membrane protein YeaQ/YmgE (transglycosylase-associated protein family)
MSMHGVGFIGAIIIGIFAGWIAEKVMNRDHGFWTNLIVGLVGSLLGAFLAGVLGIHFWGWVGSLLISTLGAILLLWLLGLVKK